MYQKKKMIVYGLTLLVGLGIIVASIWLDDHSFWGGVGGGLAGVGGLRLYLGWRYRKDPKFAKKTDYTYKDERNVYLAEKARSVAFVVTAFTLAIVSIVLRMCQLGKYADLCAWIMMGMLLLYFLLYWWLGKKY